jgi:hypothetical protein
MPNSTGSSQHDAVVNLLKEWKAIDNVIGLVFDTTASNTGRIKGSATAIQKKMGRSLLWLACRHHTVVTKNVRNFSISHKPPCKGFAELRLNYRG